MAAIMGAALNSCAPTSFEPVAGRESTGQPTAAPSPASETPVHEVAAGETLYSIAWESGLDYRKMAAWNGIAPPYLIVPGQKLHLGAPEKTAESSAIPSAPATHRVRRGETLYRLALHYDIDLDDLARWNEVSRPYRIVPGQILRLTAPASESETVVMTPAGSKPIRPGSRKPGTARKESVTPKKPVTTAKMAVPVQARRAVAWIWPTEGAVIESNGSTGNRGVDIIGRKGQTVRAAGEGQVVYQGGGLRGYGQLIILKHSAEFLSAYAHCDRIHVKEGEVIKRGQRIADMGSSGTDRVKLHFEIRYRGTPVDPLRYLPKK